MAGFEELQSCLEDLGILVSGKGAVGLGSDLRPTCACDWLTWRSSLNCLPSAVYCMSLNPRPHEQDGKGLAEQDARLAQHFAAADADHDGRVTFDEFAAYLPAVSGSKARSQLRAALGVEVERELQMTYRLHR